MAGCRVLYFQKAVFIKKAAHNAGGFSGLLFRYLVWSLVLFVAFCCTGGPWLTGAAHLPPTVQGNAVHHLLKCLLVRLVGGV